MQLRWLTLGSLLLFAQQQPIFHAQSNYVEVDAIVANRSGQFVPGLSAADFEIREDRENQQVATFSYVEVPGSSLSVLLPTTPIIFRPDTPQQLRIEAS